MSRRVNSNTERKELGVLTRNSSLSGQKESPGKARMAGGNGSGKAGAEAKKEVGDIQKVLDKLDKVKECLENKIDDSIRSQEFSAKQLTNKIEKVEVANSQVDAKCDELKQSNIGVKAQLKVQGTRLQELEDKIEQLERERRRSTLVIDGLPEKAGENLTEVVTKIFADLELNFDRSAYSAVFRRGRVQSDNEGNKVEGERIARHRPLVIIFKSAAEKGAVYRNLKNLKGKEEWSRIYFNDDLTETQASEQRDIRALVAFAKTRGYDAKLKAGALWLDGRSYKYHELHRLPNDISLCQAKTLHILEDKAIVFQSQHSPLSNLHPCNIIYRGEVFLSSEAAFQYTRATICGYDRVAQLIKAERRAFKVKLLARAIISTKDWEEMCEQVMREVLLEKFKRNEACASFLLSTGTRALFEGTGDKKWGCGFPISKAHLISFKNPGKNILGHLLEAIRKEIAPKDT